MTNPYQTPTAKSSIRAEPVEESELPPVKHTGWFGGAFALVAILFSLLAYNGNSTLINMFIIFSIFWYLGASTIVASLIWLSDRSLYARKWMRTSKWVAAITGSLMLLLCFGRLFKILTQQ